LQHSIYSYSIPKSQRFSDEVKHTSSQSLYTLPELRTSRAAGIGYGTRKAFNVNELSPSPSSYKILSLFDKNVSKHKGPSLTSRHNPKVFKRINI
jgi:hypothetical protein